MEYRILKDGFEESIRTKLGVKSSELSDLSINNKFISKLSESVVIKRIPNYIEIEDELDLMFLESAVLNYICYLLAPTMPNKIKNKVTTIEVKWETLKIDWVKRADDFLDAYEEDLIALDMLESSGDSQIFAIAKMGGGDEE